MPKILGLRARQVLDSRGNPTVQCELRVTKGFFSAMVPSGASTGKHEAIELRDDGPEWLGKGVSKAVGNVNTIIAKKIRGKNFESQADLDSFLIGLDATPNKARLGANAILGTSMAFCRACAAQGGKELFMHVAKISSTKKPSMPVPQMNVINGGKHAGKENDIQEHMLVPTGFKYFSDGLRASVESYQTLKAMMGKRFGPSGTHLADEGGFAPNMPFDARLEMMCSAVEESGYEGKVKIALDCAASELFEGGRYQLDTRSFSSLELSDFYSSMIDKFDIVSVEDGFAEDDWLGWEEFTSRLGSKTQIVGDDLLVTNPERIKMAVELKACNALLLKLNQVGTVSEAIEASRLAKKAGWKVIVSHRSGETEDAFIADFCVGIGAEQCKFGAPARGERTAKYNRLLAIEELLR